MSKAIAVSIPTPSDALADMAREIEVLRAQLIAAKLEKATGPRQLSFKLSEKGGVSVYGLQRFPVTLYRESWTKLLESTDRLKAFIDSNKEALDVTFAAHQASKK